MGNLEKYIRKTIYQEQRRLQPVFSDMNEYAERLNEIKDEIKDLIQEAQHLVNDFSSQFGVRHIYERARSYWLAHLQTALDKESEYLGSSMTTMEDTIQEIEETIDDRMHEESGEEIEGEPEEEII